MLLAIGHRLPCALALSLLSTLVSLPAEAAVVSAAILPHGDIAWQPEGKGLNGSKLQQAQALHAAAIDAGLFLAATHPDLILLTSPHAIADLEAFAFFLNPTAAGCVPPDVTAPHPQQAADAHAVATARVGGPCASITVDTNTSLALLKYLQDRTFKRTTALSGFGPPGEAGAPFPLSWGEIIPTRFLPEQVRNAAQFILLSMPSRRYTDAVEMVPELADLGAALFDLLEALPQRVALLVSGDLAHTHSADGPYGFSEDAAPFDEAVGSWVESLEPRFILVDAKRRMGGAKSCGFTGFALLQGSLARAAHPAAWGGSGGSRAAGGVADAWDSRLLAMHHPTYYGMAVATLQRRQYAANHSDD